MAGTATNYAPVKIHQGEGRLWVIGNPPVDATPRLTLANGTPDATEHPGSIHLGALSEGITTGLTAKLDGKPVDGFTAPFDYIIVEEEMKMEAVLKQVLDMAILQYALTHGTYGSGSGYKQLTFGGKAALAPSYCFAAISPTPADPSKYAVSLIFKGVPIPNASLAMSLRKQMEAKIEIVAMHDTTIARSAGKAMGVLYVTE
jgi:hypothetical protein